MCYCISCEADMFSRDTPGFIQQRRKQTGISDIHIRTHSPKTFDTDRYLKKQLTI
jgi:hypothetical protein